MRPLTILAMTSIRSRNAACRTSSMNPLRRANSNSGTHSWAEPRAMMKKFLRSALVKRPLPSARLVAIDRARAVADR